MRRTIALTEGFTLDRDIARRSTLDGHEEPATGLTVTAFIAATKGGETIHANLSKSAPEWEDREGGYHASWTPGDLAAYLTGYVGGTVFPALRYTLDGGVQDTKYEEFRVIAARAI